MNLLHKTLANPLAHHFLGGTLISYDTGIGDRNSSIYVEPGLKNNFTLVNAYTWEGGRGYRCDFWRSVGAVVPE